MIKRDFLKTITAVSIGMPLSMFPATAWLESLNQYPEIDHTTNEDFWSEVRKDYLLKPDYINLESGYYNIIPKPTLDHLVEHI